MEVFPVKEQTVPFCQWRKSLPYKVPNKNSYIGWEL